jgi:hypothetical protein
MPNRLKQVVIGGDILSDWNIIQIRRMQKKLTSWNWDDQAKIFCSLGGSALLTGIMEAVQKKTLDSQQAMFNLYSSNAQNLDPADQRIARAFWQLAPYPAGKKGVWRIESFLGMEPPCKADDVAEPEQGILNWMKAADDMPEEDLVLLDDAGQRFREREELWPQAIKEGGNCRWIVLKMSHPVAKGRLWETLVRNHSDRLIVVLTADDLRLSEVQISRELSWERTAQDLVWELTHNPAINSLIRCKSVVVSFDTAGAVLVSQSPNQPGTSPQGCLFFDPTHIEGSWGRENPGGMYGYTSCLVGGIACQLLQLPDGSGIRHGVQVGLKAMRNLHLAGFGDVLSDISQNRIAFPFDAVAESILGAGKTFAEVPIQDPMRFLAQDLVVDHPPLQPGFWTILEDIHQENLSGLANQIVVEGPQKALKDIPLGKFGHLLTVDRHEIESYRSFRSLVDEYIQGGKHKRPLNIAVFGAPGSGKSFGVIQVASSLLPGQIQVLEFNLSQMKNADGIISALHQVRDVNLSNKIPLVFWDEFDSVFDGRPLGWLRYFLAPMQDGAFTEGQLVHSIGKVIFVFAGGTSHRFEDFQNVLPYAEFRAAKGPDFVSRLKGFINILGPNPQKGGQPAQPSEDPYYIIRRAILLNSIFRRNTPQLFSNQDGMERLNIDPGVLRAFLHIDEYKHGIRSIESLVAMSMLADKSSFDRSDLPPESQCNLHVDGQKFIALVHQLRLEGDLLEVFAAAAHEVYCEGMRRRGYRYGPKNNDDSRTSNAMLPYDELIEDLKQQNRNNVRDIPQKLAQAGYLMTPARSNEPPFDFPGDDLEMLARMEHERWMLDKLAAGWRYGPETDQSSRTSQGLVVWEDLAEDEKEKDRDLVRGIPNILYRAGYTIIRAKA